MPIDPLNPAVLTLGLAQRARVPYDAPDVVAERQARVAQLREAAQQKQDADYENKLYDWAIKSNLGPDGMPDMEGVRKSLYAVAPSRVAKFDTAVNTAKKSQFETAKLQDEHRAAMTTWAGQAFNNADETTYGDIFPVVQQGAPELVRQYGLTGNFQHDQGAIGAVRSAATSMPEQLKAAEEARTHVMKNDYLSGIARIFEADPNLTDDTIARVAGDFRHKYGMGVTDYQTVMNLDTTKAKSWAANLLHPTTPHEQVQEDLAKGTLAETKREHDLMQKAREDAAARTVGSFEDYVARAAKEQGKDPTTFTTDDIDKLREKYRLDQRPSVTVNTGTAVIPGNFAVTGPAFLDTIPLPWRATVKKIANYDEDPTKVTSMRGGMRETLMQWVNQVNPAYDATTYANRAPTRKAFTTGIQGRQINNINTAIGHIDQLDTLASELQTGGFVPGNRAWNAIRTAFGSDTVTNFDTLKDALAGEVAGVLSQSGATVSGIAEARAKISAANSPTQLAGYVKTLIPVMGAKLGNLDYQYHQAMGAEDPFSPLSPESQRILRKHGIDPAQLASPAKDGASASTTRRVGEQVTLKSGQRVTVTKVYPDGSFDYK